MKRLFLSTLLLGTLALLSGCSSAGDIMAGLRFELASIEREGAKITVRVVNPNMVAYNLDRVTYTVQLDGRVVGTMEVRKPTGVPAQNVALQTGTLVLAPGATLAPGSANYRMDFKVVLRLYDDRTEDAKMSAVGTVVVK
jgi:hypothetical protein